MSSLLKTIGKILFTVFIIIYAFIVVFTTACLFGYNDEGITEFGNTTLLIMDSDMSDEYIKGDLVVVSKSKKDEIGKGDYIFYYQNGTVTTVKYSEVSEIAYSDVYDAYTYTVGDNYLVYDSFLIGRDATVLKGVGSILEVLESQYGFLILIIMPTMIGIVFELYLIVMEIVAMKKED